MLIERHIFGSFRGYTTLGHSSAVTPADCKLLEGSAYAFGQSEDKRYLKSLRSAPAYFTRLLPGGRRGLTRVLDGQADDNGRPTLLMITAILNQRDWDTELAGDLRLLLNDSEIWQSRAGEALLAIESTYSSPSSTVSRRSITKITQLISQLETNLPSGARTVVTAEDFSQDELVAAEMLMPAAIRPRFASAWRSLSPQLNVNLNCIAAECPAQQVTFRPGRDAILSPYAEFLLDAGLDNGVLPLGEALTYNGFGRRKAAANDPTGAFATAPPPPPPPMPSRHMRPIASIFAVGIIVAFAVGFWAGFKYSAARSRAIASASATPENGAPRSPQLGDGPRSSATTTQAANNPTPLPAATPPAVATAIVPTSVVPAATSPSASPSEAAPPAGVPVAPPTTQQTGHANSGAIAEVTKGTTTSAATISTTDASGVRRTGLPSGERPEDIQDQMRNLQARTSEFEKAKSAFAELTTALREKHSFSEGMEKQQFALVAKYVQDMEQAERTAEEAEWLNQRKDLFDSLSKMHAARERLEISLDSHGDPHPSVDDIRHQAKDLKDAIAASASAIGIPSDRRLVYETGVKALGRAEKLEPQHNH